MVFTREFNHNFGKMIAWFLVLVILTGLLMALYPMMLDENMKSLFDSFVGQLSPSLQKVLGFDRKVDYANISEYIAFVYQYIVVLTCIFAMQLGANSLSRDLDDGSIQYVYSNPIERSEIITQKFLSNIITYVIFLLLLAVVTFFITVLPPLTEGLVNNVLIVDLGKIFLGLLLSGLVFMSVGMFFSSLSKSTNFTDGTSVLFVIFIVIFIIFGKIYGGTILNVVNTLPLEVFNPIEFLAGNIDIVKIGINFLVFIILILLTYLIYNSKDLDY